MQIKLMFNVGCHAYRPHKSVIFNYFVNYLSHYSALDDAKIFELPFDTSKVVAHVQ